MFHLVVPETKKSDLLASFFCLVFVFKDLVFLRENNLTEFLAIWRKHVQTVS